MTLGEWLYTLGRLLDKGERPEEIPSQFSKKPHKIEYKEDEFGPYALLHFDLYPVYDGRTFTEIDSDTFGTLNGFRFYLEETEDGTA